MTATTLDDSMIRLQSIKSNKHLYNKSKIAEAEALADEALRMAGEAKLAAARLAEVKKTLSMFSRKLEKVERTVQREVNKPKSIVIQPIVRKEPVKVVEAPVKVEEPVVVETPVVEAVKNETVVEAPEVVVEVKEVPTKKQEPVEETAAVVEEPVNETVVVEEAVEEPTMEDAPTFVAGASQPDPFEDNHSTFVARASQPDPFEDNHYFVDNCVVKVAETGNQKVSRDAPAARQRMTAPLPTVVSDVSESIPQGSQKDFIEGALDSFGVDKMCGVDDDALGYVVPDIVVPAHFKQFEPALAPITQIKQPTSRSSPQAPPTPNACPFEQNNAYHAASAPMVMQQVQNQSMQQVQNESQIVVEDNDKDIIEDFLDSLGVDKMCGVDDGTLGFTDRPELPPPPPPTPPPVFENPTRVAYKELNTEESLHSVSWKDKLAAQERKQRNLQPKTFQRAPVNGDFADPFGVDHDDLVFCGKLADLCEPPEFDDYEEYVVQQQNAAPSTKNVSFKSE